MEKSCSEGPVIMPVVSMGVAWIVILDFIVWFLLSIFCALAAFKRNVDSFRPDGFLYRPRRWEGGGRVYEKYLFVKAWKPLLPDGAKPFKGGFEKKNLRSRDAAYLEEFIKESCRAELTHWLLIFVSPVFFIWNPPFVGLIMIAYALVMNLPCIITQRYNRPRFITMLDRERQRLKSSSTPC